MKRSEEAIRLDSDLKENAQLREKIEAAVQETIKSGECKSDGEAMEKALKSLGYDIPKAELERMQAESQQMSLEEMENVAGGTQYEKEWGELCNSDYWCMVLWDTKDQDEKGHNSWCVTAWHCDMATLHTETDSKEVSCWSNYTCKLISQPEKKSPF